MNFGRPIVIGHGVAVRPGQKARARQGAFVILSGVFSPWR
jgi:hypothetical protein